MNKSYLLKINLVLLVISLVTPAHAFKIKPSHLNCSNTKECTLINSSCSSYFGVAVAKKYEQTYQKLLKMECRHNKDPKASMAEGGPYQVSCENKKCIILSK